MRSAHPSAIILLILWIASAQVVPAQSLNVELSAPDPLPKRSMVDMGTDRPVEHYKSLAPDKLPSIPAAYDYHALGLFCKLDVQFERYLPLPVLFRLGDVQQVEGWEGKGPLAPIR